MTHVFGVTFGHASRPGLERGTHFADQLPVLAQGWEAPEPPDGPVQVADAKGGKVPL